MNTQDSDEFLQNKIVAATFGSIVSILARSPSHRHYTLGDIEWLIIPPIAYNQFLVADARQDDGANIPTAVIFWAGVSEELDARLTAAPRYPIRLHPKEWNSGDTIWIVDAIGSQPVLETMLGELKKTVFKDRTVKRLTRDTDGRLSVSVSTNSK